MLHTHMQGASAPGPVTPTSDNAGVEPGASRGNEEGAGLDSASAPAERKLIDGLAARAALLGAEVHRRAGGAWLLRHHAGAHIGVVHGADALAAAISGFEAAQADVRELVQCLRGSA